MSGVEVAGLVLGALPVLVEAIKAYADGVSTAERYLKYRIPLLSVHRALRAESVIYLNTCEKLLDGIVDDNEERAVLLEDPGGPAWKKAKLDTKLKQRLPREYTAYVDTMEDMQMAIEQIKKLVKLDADGKVQFNATTKFRKEYHRLRFSLKKQDYDDLVAQIRQHNKTLQIMTEQALVLEPRRSRAANKLPDLSVIQKYATSVYNALCPGLHCGCQTAHGINLRLERISKPSATNSDTGSSLPVCPPLRVLLSSSLKPSVPEDTPWSLKAVDIRPLEHGSISQPGTPASQPASKRPTKSVRFQTPTPDETANATQMTATATATMTIRTTATPMRPKGPIHIQNLCQAIRQTKQKVCIDRCVGFFEDTCIQQTFGLYQPESTSFLPHEKPALLPLRVILTSGTIGNRRFSRLHRLRLAVLLSSGMLQLHHTPWLDETWDDEDISFLEAEGADGDAVLKEPFVTRPSPRAGDDAAAAAARDDGGGTLQWRGIFNRSIFALGILLLELSLGKPLEELRKRPGAPAPPSATSNGGSDPNAASDDGGRQSLRGRRSELSDFAAVEELLDDVRDESSPGYADAVRRCVRCSFDTRRVDLGDELFRQAVYDGVVASLEKELRHFERLEA